LLGNIKKCSFKHREHLRIFRKKPLLIQEEERGGQGLEENEASMTTAFALYCMVIVRLCLLWGLLIFAENSLSIREEARAEVSFGHNR
jgi:hypothetical protein